MGSLSKPPIDSQMRGCVPGPSKSETHGWVIHGTPGSPKSLPKDALHVDHSYQREAVSNSRILTMAREWYWWACAPLIVALRPSGEYVVIDGQHRLLAACKIQSIVLLPCHVFLVASVEEEARMFYTINVLRKAVTSYEKYKSLNRADDAEVAAVRQMVEETGYKISQNESPFTVRCISSLRSWHQKSPEVCRAVWKAASGFHAGEPIKEAVFRGLCYVEWQLSRIGGGLSALTPQNLAKLNDLGPSAIMQSINRARTYYTVGGERVEAQGIVDLLNKGRRTRRLPPMMNSSGSDTSPVDTAENGVG